MTRAERNFKKIFIANNLKPVLTTKVIEMVPNKNTILQPLLWSSIEIKDGEIVEIVKNIEPTAKAFISQSVIKQINARYKGFRMVPNKVRT